MLRGAVLRGSTVLRGAVLLRPAVLACVVCAAGSLLATAALAGAGSGSATILPSSAVPAGVDSMWNITYTAAEDFPITGGMIEVTIPPGWTAPQKTSTTSKGYVNWTDASKVDSVTISGYTIRVFLGGPGSTRFLQGDAVSVLYGVGGTSSEAQAQTNAPATATFLVQSDPQLTGSPLPIASSPQIQVIPGPVASVRVVDAALDSVGALSLDTDQDTTRLYLRGCDQYGNSARFVRGNWSVTGGIGSPIPAVRESTVLRLSAVGTGFAVGDSGAWRDSTGLISVVHGAYAGLASATDSAAVAGIPFAVTARAEDADGNTVTNGAGSGAAIQFFAYAGPSGPATTDPDFVSAGAMLSGGAYSGTLTARRSGTFYVAAIDSATGFVSPRGRVVVGPAPPDRMTLDPDTLRLTAGVPDTVTVRVFDSLGNRSPVLAPETLTLWTDRPAGSFQSLAGATIFEVTVPAGGDSARFQFRDTQTTLSEGRIRAIDANGVSPFLGTAGAPVFTTPNVPTGTIALDATPDTLVANGADSVLVSGLAHDAYGNVVAQGERFTFTGALLTPVTDQDPGTPGAQLLADSTGAVRGYARAGSASGAGSVSVSSIVGSAVGTAPIGLLAGAPSGPIALSASPDSLAADSVSTLAITATGLHDGNGNTVEEGEEYTIATTRGAIAAADADPPTPGVQVLAAGGAISFMLFGGDSLGTATVTAAAVRNGASSGSLDVRLVPGSVSAGHSAVVADSPVPVGGAGSVVRVTLRDGQDHPLAGVPSDSVGVLITDAPVVVTTLATETDASGRIDFRAATSIAGSATVRVTARGVALTAQPVIVFQPGPLDHYAAAGPAGPLIAGAAETLAIQASDSFGNALPGRSGDVLRPAVTAGGATVPDSVLLVGGSATIPFTPTVAAPLTISVRDDSSRSVTYGPVAVNPGAAAALSIAPSSLSLTPTQPATVTVTVRDAQGNPVPSYSVTVFLGGTSAAGSLESLGGTTGGPGSQTGATDSVGTLAVRYRAPSAAPAADSILARDASVGPVGIRATTAPGPTVALRVSPATLSWTAGVSESVRVEAVDAFGNLAVGDGAVVTMRPAGSVAWSPGSGALAAGAFVTVGRDTVAESIPIAADRLGGGSGTGGSVAVAPAAPAGTIPISASRDSLTADGRSSATVTLGPVRDAFGNLVSTGTLIGVSARSGTLLASDASTAYPGLDLATAADGTASVLLIAPATPGADTISAATRLGSAAGTHAFTYVAPPSLAYVAGSLTPGSVVPGSSATFALQARNTGSGTIRLEPGSIFSFGSGAAVFSAPLASAISIPSGSAASLGLATAAVPAGLAPGLYAPSFRVVGTDATGERFDFYLSLGATQVGVAGITVTAVSASPDPVPLGYSSLLLVFDVANPSGTTGSLTGASLSYSAGAFLPNGSPTPALPAPVPAGGATRISIPVQVPTSGLASGTVVQARLHAAVDFAGSTVLDSNATALSFQVVSAARIAAVAGSGTPQRLLRGRPAGPTLRVENTGEAAVTLYRGTTRLVLARGADTLTTALSANTAVGASEQAALSFDSLAVPAGVAKGRYFARLFLDGSESGQAFVDTIPSAPDSVDVLDPALLAVLPGSIDPDTVSAGQVRPVSVSLRNSGDVPFVLDASTALRLGAPLSVLRTLGTSVAVNAGQTIALSFSGGPLGSAGSSGTSAATLEASGTEDGIPRAQSLVAGVLDAEPPSALQFVAGSAAPHETRPGDSIDLSLEIQNVGGSPFVLDPAASRFAVSDGVDVMTAGSSGAPFTLAPGARATLVFAGVAVPAAMASQAYPIELDVRGSEWGAPESVSVSSPGGELVILEAPVAIQVRALDAAAPVQVAPGGPPIRAWGLELTPLLQTGSSTRDSVRSVAITVLADGSSAAAPGSAVAAIALRDAAGVLRAQAVSPGPSNPVTLDLNPPLILTSAPESLFVEVSIVAGAQVSRVALELSQASDVLALDAATGSRVPVVGGGGLPFAALASPEITLFEKPHGYPNPFHAGREAVLLSYVLRQDATVKVSIYTLLGDLVREIPSAAGARGGSTGLNEVPWDGRNGRGDLVRPGVYVARIEGSGVSEQVKVGVLR